MRVKLISEFYSKVVNPIHNSGDRRTPRRTAEHKIADLSVNHVERIFLEAGHVPQAILKDYGYDLTVTTHDVRGFAENGLIYLQLKASQRLRSGAGSRGYSFSILRKHYEQWRKEPSPVFLIRYCATSKRAYYLYLQPYFDARPSLFKRGRKSATIFIPKANLLDESAVRYMRERKRNILKQTEATIVDSA
jgi:hypothetical protein